jgi:hypothetical protein
VFAPGLSAVREVADRDAREEFHSAPPDRFDWPRLFRLQMAYLLLWTIIERYASLAYGPTLRPEEKIERFGQDPAFKRALKGVVTRAGEVYDSQDPEIPPARLDPEHPVSSAYYYRRVRHNLTHRGKGAWKDGEINRKSLVELQGIVDHVLTERVGLQGGSSRPPKSPRAPGWRRPQTCGSRGRSRAPRGRSAATPCRSYRSQLMWPSMRSQQSGQPA